MATLTLKVSDSVKSWVEEQVEAGLYDSADELFEDMVFQHQNHQAVPRPMSVEELDERLRRSAEGGISDRTLDEIFHDAVQRYEARQATRG